MIGMIIATGTEITNHQEEAVTLPGEIMIRTRLGVVETMKEIFHLNLEIMSEIFHLGPDSIANVKVRKRPIYQSCSQKVM
jgi:hypothetical protein